MPEFDKIVPDSVGELEPLGGMTVIREQVLKYQLDGTPITRPMGAGRFTEIKRSLEWICEAPDCRHEITIPLPGVSLFGFLAKDEESNLDYLTLSSGERTSISPHIYKDEYVALSDNVSVLDIFYVLEPEQNILIDRGLVVIELHKDGSAPNLRLNFNPGEHTVPEMADSMTSILKRINVVTNRLLDGTYSNFGY